jgi:hypothetical protein
MKKFFFNWEKSEIDRVGLEIEVAEQDRRDRIHWYVQEKEN